MYRKSISGDAMAAFLKSIDDLRAVQWDGSWLWDIQFTGGNGTMPPTPFNNWFPATSVSEQRWALNHRTIDAPFTDINVPESTTPGTISIEYVDNQNTVLTKWLANWINLEIMNGLQFLTCLKESTKQLTIVKLNYKREIVESRVHLVIPVGESVYMGDSQSGLPTYSATFTMVGGDRSTIGPTTPQ